MIIQREDVYKEIVELELTFPIPPVEGDEKVRAKEVSARLTELYNFLFQDGPVPSANWKPSVAVSSGEERERIKKFWFEYERKRL